MPDRVSASSAKARSMEFAEATDLERVRSFVHAQAIAAGLPVARADLLMLAVSELATNALQHTSSGGMVRIWSEGSSVVCEVHDRGPVHERAAQASMPPASALRGRGLAIVQQVCDIVDIMPAGTTTVVRLHMAI